MSWFLPAGYESMGFYLNKTGRPMLYSCEWPLYVCKDNPEKVNYVQCPVTVYMCLRLNVVCNLEFIYDCITFFMPPD